MSLTETEFNLNDAEVTDVSPEDFGAVPDHTASRQERRGFLSYMGIGKPKEDEEKTRRGRAQRSAPPRKPRKRVSAAKKGAFVEPLMEMYGFAALTIMMRGDEHCATVIAENAEKCAETLDELAYQNESVRRVLDTLTTGSAIGAVMMAHVPIIMAIASHHGGGKVPNIPGMNAPKEAPAA